MSNFTQEDLQALQRDGITLFPLSPPNAATSPTDHCESRGTQEQQPDVSSNSSAPATCQDQQQTTAAECGADRAMCLNCFCPTPVCTCSLTAHLTQRCPSPACPPQPAPTPTCTVKTQLRSLPDRYKPTIQPIFGQLYLPRCKPQPLCDCEPYVTPVQKLQGWLSSPGVHDVLIYMIRLILLLAVLTWIVLTLINMERAYTFCFSWYGLFVAVLIGAYAYILEDIVMMDVKDTALMGIYCIFGRGSITVVAVFILLMKFVSDRLTLPAVMVLLLSCYLGDAIMFYTIIGCTWCIYKWDQVDKIEQVDTLVSDLIKTLKSQSKKHPEDPFMLVSKLKYWFRFQVTETVWKRGRLEIEKKTFLLVDEDNANGLTWAMLDH